MAKAAVKSRMREEVIEEDRAPARLERPEAVPKGRAVAVGRDGKPVWRKVSGNADQFAVDPRMIPDGWSYEWKRETIYNEPDPAYQAELASNGWTPVPCERHDGVFLPHGTQGAIRRGGLILMERPAILTEEARIEDKRNADRALRSAYEVRGLMNADPSFVDFDHGGAQKASFVNREVERAPARERTYAIDE